MGAVLSSTDAASVFSVLRTKKLNLKDGTASILEMESGSNDPVAYLLTMICIMMKTGGSLSSLPYMIFAQVVFGLAIGAAKKGTTQAAGMDMILVIALVMIAFGLSEAIGGNAFLTVYLMGILLGNSNIRGKETLIPFFDGMTGLAQIVLFFLLGLLSFPHKLPQIFFVSLAIAIVLTVIIHRVCHYGDRSKFVIIRYIVSYSIYGGSFIRCYTGNFAAICSREAEDGG